MLIQVQTGWQYDAKAIEFQHARHLIEQNKRQPTKENRMMNGEPDEVNGTAVIL